LGVLNRDYFPAVLEENNNVGGKKKKKKLSLVSGPTSRSATIPDHVKRAGNVAGRGGKADQKRIQSEQFEKS